MEKKLIQKMTVPDLIVKHIEELLTSGNLKPGDKLPSERELMELFSVGRTSVREALKALIAIGVVVRNREGTFIGDTSSLFLSPVTKEIILRRSNLRELWEARKLLEVGLAGLAAESITAVEIDELQKILANTERLVIDDSDKFIEADIAFHHAIAEAAQNQVLMQIFVGIREMVEEAQRKILETVPGVKQRAFLEHKRVVEAVKQGDKKLAEEAMLEHLKLGLEFIDRVE